MAMPEQAATIAAQIREHLDSPGLLPLTARTEQLLRCAQMALEGTLPCASCGALRARLVRIEDAARAVLGKYTPDVPARDPLPTADLPWACNQLADLRAALREPLRRETETDA